MAPAVEIRRLEERLLGYPLPVLRLARLGVDRRVQGQGIGEALLGFAPVDGVRQGLLHGEPAPMFLALATVAAVG